MLKAFKVKESLSKTGRVQYHIKKLVEYNIK